jgi:glycyl-tRNA synthetase
MVNYAGVVIETLNLPLPFGVASVGPVVRDLVGEDTVSSASPPDRLKEFQQMEMLFFCHSSEAHDAYIYWQKQRLRWWKQYSDDPERFSVKETHSDQLPSNELQASVIKFEVPWFSNVVETVKSYQPSSDGTSVIRTAAGLDRGFWALLADAHWNRFPEKHNELQVLRLNEMLAPFKVAVIVGNPSNKKQILFGRQLSLELKKTEITTRFSSQGTPEENYIKEDESGTPYCVVVDDTTMSSGVLGFRHRNNGLAVRWSHDSVW